ncbi:MAG: hypothetical protein Q9191_007979, partial [Dirinaria sp. TL-2023a]
MIAPLSKPIYTSSVAGPIVLPQDIGVPYIGITSSQPSHPPFFEDGGLGHAPFSGRAFTGHCWQEPIFDDYDHGEVYYEDDLAEYSDDPYSDDEAVFNRTIAHANQMGFRTSWGAAVPPYAGSSGMAARGSTGGGYMAAHGGRCGHAGGIPATAAAPSPIDGRSEHPGRSGPTGRPRGAESTAAAGTAEAGRVLGGEGASRRGMHGPSVARISDAERFSRPDRGNRGDRGGPARPVTDSEDQEGD